MNKTYDESLRIMIQTREPPFEGNVISTFNAMDGQMTDKFPYIHKPVER